MNEIESRNSMNEKSRSFVKKNVCFCFDTDLNVCVPQKRGVSSVFPNKKPWSPYFYLRHKFLVQVTETPTACAGVELWLTAVWLTFLY